MTIKKKLILSIILLCTVSSVSFLTIKYTLNSRKQTALKAGDVQEQPVEESVIQETETQLLIDDNTIEDITDESKVENEETKTEVEEGPKIIEYIVKPGDTLEAISKEYGVSVNTITQSNNISSSDLLKVGEKLRFPSILGVLYKIKSGETLWDISSTYNLKVQEIAKANNIDSTDKIKIGQEIILPGVDKLIVKEKSTPVSTSNSTKSVKVASRSSSSSSSASGIWPVRGTVTSRFGPRWGKKHNGMDIAAPTGTTVSAYMDGTVTFSGWRGEYGNLVIINHGNGLQTYYAHNSKLLVSEGEKVTKGQAISKVGSTGNSTGPHLHFEVRKNGTAVDPSNYLR